MKKKSQWIIILIITVFVSMYIYGMTRVYFPDPIHIGLGQYLDISVGIIIVVLIFTSSIIAIIFKKKKWKK